MPVIPQMSIICSWDKESTLPPNDGPWTLSNYNLSILEIQQYGHPGDEDRNFCVLCLIDFSIIAIRVFKGGGGGMSSI